LFLKEPTAHDEKTWINANMAAAAAAAVTRRTAVAAAAGMGTGLAAGVGENDGCRSAQPLVS
jgi:hypothetical protein